ncbi:MarR family transcriptional regulator [Clostridium sp. AM58-1XD]|uniref:MarR family winged helix-turn-helix transcriptional regulator n=1 Tax=Clostridium sp. AM58-1XD TaxID=2292307 RepID=UPI000E5089E8|nr:MarR family transcriptional regulator [Clostridium sp. AM58-1XD]RGY96192.1 MarR family transcriptional regulator [Clostridium sp. AM58-1XD]
MNDGAGRDFTLEDLTKNLVVKADLLYKFVLLYSNYLSSSKDYGTGNMVSMVEVHTLTQIYDNPGITVTQLANYWRRTKSAVSQTVGKLESRGLITRTVSENNKKVYELYVTEEGRKLSAAHKAYDLVEISHTLEDLLKTCTYDEIDTFYKVLESYIHLFEE